MAMVGKVVQLAYDGPLTVSTLGSISDTVRGMYLEQNLSGDAHVDITDEGQLVKVVITFGQDGLY